MTPDEIRRKYAIRMSLPEAERAEVERLHAELVGKADAAWRGTGPESLDPADAAAVEIAPDPDMATPVGASAHSGPASSGPSTEQDASQQYGDDWVAARTSELVARGMDPSVAPASALAEADAYGRGMKPEEANRIGGQEASRMFTQNELDAREGRRQDLVARGDSPERAAIKSVLPGMDTDATFDPESDRQGANIRRLLRAGVNPGQDMSAPSLDQQDAFDTWARSGSVDRMERYAPGEADRRWNAAAAERSKENERMRSDPEYRAQQIAKEKQYMTDTLPNANNALRRQLQQMGVPTDKFESNATSAQERNEKFDRSSAYAALQEAKNAEKAYARKEVQKRAMLRQNPMGYMGRDDVGAEQKAMLSAMMLGRGATPNDIKALQAKMFLEGMQEGARRNVNVNNPLAQEAQAAMAMEQIAGQREARRRPDEDVLGEKYAPTGYFGYDEFTVDEQQSMYEDLVSQGYSSAEAQRAVDRQATKRRASTKAEWRSSGGE